MINKKENMFLPISNVEYKATWNILYVMNLFGKKIKDLFVLI